MSTHVSKVRAVKAQVELHQAFIDEGLRADQAMQKSGLGYEARAVHDYLANRARGNTPRRPKAVRWRG
jgi:hypothetical protein